ncbi:hypothetical protein Rs2_22148 [Raphanus sativus]|nr:hypothetical protein Rs2_22148 [Raphanus sativus]
MVGYLVMKSDFLQVHRHMSPTGSLYLVASQELVYVVGVGGSALVKARDWFSKQFNQLSSMTSRRLLLDYLLIDFPLSGIFFSGGTPGSATFSGQESSLGGMWWPPQDRPSSLGVRGVMGIPNIQGNKENSLFRDSR